MAVGRYHFTSAFLSNAGNVFQYCEAIEIPTKLLPVGSGTVIGLPTHYQQKSKLHGYFRNFVFLVSLFLIQTNGYYAVNDFFCFLHCKKSDGPLNEYFDNQKHDFYDASVLTIPCFMYSLKMDC